MQKLILPLAIACLAFSCSPKKEAAIFPVVIATWDSGKPVCEASWEVLSQTDGRALDAVEKGANSIENTINCCVGLGGNPDRDGHVTLDASIMDEQMNCGSVAFLERIKNPISVARAVMEKTPHVMLVGEGAQQFAVENGFTLESGELSEGAKKSYEKWLEKSEYKPVINIEQSQGAGQHVDVPKKLENGDYNHDTMGLLALDNGQNLSGACTTSGMGFKMRGRVGDSPIIGSGLFVDNEVGAAVATGQGEEVIRVAGTHLVVEFMRQGNSPEDACRLACERIINVNPEKAKTFQVAFIALNKAGEYGGYAIQPNFSYAIKKGEQDTEVIKAKSHYSKEDLK
ncbi:N(4)-(beta-N-acetylglucosaminyl)-L-asparaginase [Marinilongibacter aquaticus]|uniref:N(4)-(beta-N-acetylglucosaminyl)-L-asparaginase n=1 Tax=Marinilongibacter aquaticus TaxID=2975157 RepID=UPI0021BD9386|nr:N(4)-(beta-N-acetylglucosaminyl)-L-asparaginase [Marinilongibacter aquaticus]UBM57786.1 N(4)-(beta-N-acetylglucosaminyl)-L-asparaginase [Marinilongibacter aquaticus]